MNKETKHTKFLKRLTIIMLGYVPTIKAITKKRLRTRYLSF